MDGTIHSGATRIRTSEGLNPYGLAGRCITSLPPLLDQSDDRSELRARYAMPSR